MSADATTHLRTERDLLFALAPDPVAFLDPAGQVTEANPAWTTLLGWPLTHIVGRALPALAHEDDRDRLDAALRGLAAAPVDGLRLRLQARSGGYRWLEWTLRALADGRLYATARDVTGQVRARDALLHHREDLEARIAARTAELDAALARLRLHGDTSPLATIEWDPQLRVSTWSRRASEMFGWSADELHGRPAARAPLFDAAGAAAFEAAMGPLLRRESPRHVHMHRVRTRDGRVLVCEWFDSVVFDAQGEVASILSLVQDVTAREAAAAALADSEERFRLAFEQTAVGMAHVALDGRWLRMNRRLVDMLGRADAITHRQRLPDIVHADDRAETVAALARLQAGGVDAISLEKRVLRADGHAMWTRQSMSLRRDADGAPAHFIVVIEDIDARRRAEQALQAAHAELEEKVAERTRELERLMAVFENQARQDPLTGLPNRRGLMERLPRALERSGRQNGGVAVMFVDLDRFKQVNDRLGHEAGDALLRECARRLLATVRKTDIVARLGGDEFVVVLENVRDVHAQARQVAEKLRRVLALPVPMPGGAVVPSASIGLVVHGEGATTPEALIARADDGMYVAKHRGGNAVHMHTDAVEPTVAAD